MSKETLVIIIGIFVFFSSFVGIPTSYKKWLLVFSGIILAFVGYRLRRNAFLMSIKHESGERRGGAFVESDLSVPEVTTRYKDSDHM